MTVKLLAIGDIHLGRRPTKLNQQQLEAHGIDFARLTPAEAWRRAVTYAVDHKVNAVLLAGDLVESMSDRFEALGHIVSGLQRLHKEEITVYAVAGNHDAEALPRIAAQVENLNILGADGAWESTELKNGPFPVRLIGRSFTKAEAANDALDSYNIIPDQSIPSIGLLHADLNASGSQYAPVSKSGLQATGLSAWLLGHIHRPDDLSTDPIGYLGSLAGLDPGEPGCHGPVLVEITSSSEITFTRIPIAPLRWDTLNIALSNLDAEEVDATSDTLSGMIRERLRRAAQELPSPQPDVLAVRLRLRGNVKHHRRLRESIAQCMQLAEPIGDTLVIIEKIIDESREPVDLDILKQQKNPPGTLAAIMQQFRESPDHPLQTEIREALKEHFSRTIIPGEVTPNWSDIDNNTLQHEIEEQCYELLESLLAQTEEAS